MPPELLPVSGEHSRDAQPLELAYLVRPKPPITQVLYVPGRALEHFASGILQVVPAKPQHQPSNAFLQDQPPRKTDRRVLKVGLSRGVPKSSTSFEMAAVLAEIF